LDLSNQRGEVICEIGVVVLEWSGKEERLDQGRVGHCGGWKGGGLGCEND
jgi:hypothetical protein